MVLRFSGATNDDLIWVDAVTFMLPDEETVTIQRNIAEYVVDEGRFELTWRGCYETIGTKHKYISAMTLKHAKLVSVSVKEDAPKDYKFEIETWSVDS